MNNKSKGLKEGGDLVCSRSESRSEAREEEELGPSLSVMWGPWLYNEWGGKPLEVLSRGSCMIWLSFPQDPSGFCVGREWRGTGTKRWISAWNLKRAHVCDDDTTEWDEEKDYTNKKWKLRTKTGSTGVNETSKKRADTDKYLIPRIERSLRWSQWMQKKEPKTTRDNQ